MKKKRKFKAVIAMLLLFAMLSSSGVYVAHSVNALNGEKSTVSSSSKAHKHSVKSWTVTEKATTKNNGKRSGKCSKCGKKVTQSIAKISSVTLKYEKRVYTGEGRRNVLTVKDDKGKTLEKNRDYTVTYKNNKSIGRATLTVKFIGNYSGKVNKYFYIVPYIPKITSADAKKTKITLKWEEKTKQVDGYKISYSKNKSFKNEKIVKLDTNVKNATVKGLDRLTTYYVRIKAYTEVNGKKFYSPWSRYKKVTTKGDMYDVAYCVSESKRVKSSYFDDAVFVGDSISLGLNYYNASNNLLGKAKFLTAGSLGATSALWDVSNSSVHPRYNGKKMKIEDAIALMDVKKVYIMFGMNDLGLVSDDKAIENYKTLCANIKKKSPNVVFYIQSVTPRIKMTSESQRQDLTNERIAAYNKKLSAMCEQKGWYFINVATAMCDKNGNLKNEYCGDPNAMGMHLMAAGFEAWVNYLYTHTA